ncbi:hypothetical protein [Nocardia sp. NPDC052566]|uniref:hypothetical protein n=1 Tax=Nocardia sp. NPDC052566 TaxID=3364330 RepID=UPI0037CB4224
MSTDDAENTKDTEKIEDATDNVVADDAVADKDAAVTDAAADASEDTVALAKPAAEKKQAKQAKPARPSGAAQGTGNTTPPLIAAFVAGVLLVGAITAVVLFFLQAKNRGDELSARDDALAAGCKFGRDVSLYDYSKDLDAYFDRVKGDSTGEFLSQFSDASKALKDGMTKAQVKSWSDDLLCGYQSGDKDSAKVLVTMTQFRTNFAQPVPDRGYFVVVATMKRDGDKWLVEKLDSPLTKDQGLGGLPGAPAPNQQAPAQPAPNSQAPAPGN